MALGQRRSSHHQAPARTQQPPQPLWELGALPLPSHLSPHQCNPTQPNPALPCQQSLAASHPRGACAATCARRMLADLHQYDLNDGSCWGCGGGGDMICCDGCKSIWHTQCVGVKEV